MTDQDIDALVRVSRMWRELNDALDAATRGTRQDYYDGGPLASPPLVPEIETERKT